MEIYYWIQRWKAETEDGYEIIAENFIYNKLNNISELQVKLNY